MLTLAALLAMSWPLTAQDARSAALGGCFVGSRTPLAATVWPGDSAAVALGVSGGYGLAPLTTARLGASTPLGSLALGSLALAAGGDAAMHELRMGAAFAMQLTPQLALAAEGRFLRLASDDAHYPATGRLAATAAMRWCPSARLLLEGRVGFWPDYDRTAPVALVGMAYSALRGLTVVVEGGMDRRPALRAGAEYWLADAIAARMGVAAWPLRASFGIGFRHRSMQLDLSAVRHTVLGYTTDLSIAIAL